MADEIINKNHPRIVAAREKSRQAFDSLTALRESHHIIIDGISFLNDKEVAALLRVPDAQSRTIGIRASYLIT